MAFYRSLRKATMVAVALAAASAAATAATAAAATTPRRGGGWSHAHNPSPPALLLPVARPSCDMVLPGCEAELLRFENDYVKFRCLPQSASDYLVDLAKDTLEVFKDVEKQSCCVTTAENATLYANIGTLMNAAAISGSCGFPYTSLPDYSADAYKCHGMSECDDVLEDFEDDYVKHGCMPTGNSVHDEFAISLLEMFKDIEKADCCVVRAQRLRLAADLVWLGKNTGCTPNFPTRRFAAMNHNSADPSLLLTDTTAGAPGAASVRTLGARQRRSRHGKSATTTSGASTVAAIVPPPSDAVATANTVPAGIAVRNYWNYGDDNPNPIATLCCNFDVHFSTKCCNVFCDWAIIYLGSFVTLDECCVGSLLTPKKVTC